MISFRKLLKVVPGAVAAALALAPSSLLACAACTGKTDSSLAVGMNWGIVTLLGFVVTMLSCFALFFVHVARRTPPVDDETDGSGPVN